MSVKTLEVAPARFPLCVFPIPVANGRGALLRRVVFKDGWGGMEHLELKLEATSTKPSPMMF